MTSVVAIVAFLALILLVVIPLHEFGHLLVAKRFGFKASEYFVGFGPRLWSTRRGETEYGVKAIPAGGYVKIAGMNPYEPVAPEDLPRAYGSKPIWQRALVILAGPASHFLMGGILLFVLFVGYGVPIEKTVVVDEVTSTLGGAVSPASEVGLRPGDVVVRVGDLENPTQEQLGPYVTRYARRHPGQPLEYVVERDGERITLPMIPRLVTEDGITKGRVGFTLDLQRSASPPEAAWWAIRYTGKTTVAAVTSLDDIFGPRGIGRMATLLFTDEPRRTGDPTTVVGVSQQVGDAGSRGDWGTIIAYAAYVTIFIGIVNLLPLPPLDGGHLMLLAWEKVTGRQVDYRRVVPVAATVIVFLSLFMVAALLLDVFKPIPQVT
ncbi:MAG TPA: M50 family metallopeptidase [Actinomycetota bacterium]|nr:M50 family metallopeptidase [Actinomycetota bacterium]